MPITLDTAKAQLNALFANKPFNQMTAREKAIIRSRAFNILKALRDDDGVISSPTPDSSAGSEHFSSLCGRTYN